MGPERNDQPSGWWPQPSWSERGRKPAATGGQEAAERTRGNDVAFPDAEGERGRNYRLVGSSRLQDGYLKRRNGCGCDGPPRRDDRPSGTRNQRCDCSSTMMCRVADVAIVTAVASATNTSPADDRVHESCAIEHFALRIDAPLA